MSPPLTGCLLWTCATRSTSSRTQLTSLTQTRPRLTPSFTLPPAQNVPSFTAEQIEQGPP